MSQRCLLLPPTTPSVSRGFAVLLRPRHLSLCRAERPTVCAAFLFRWRLLSAPTPAPSHACHLYHWPDDRGDRAIVRVLFASSSTLSTVTSKTNTRVPGRIAWYACALKDLSTEALWTQFAVRAAALVRLACCYRCVFDTLEVVQPCCMDRVASRALPADTAAFLVRWKRPRD